MTSIDVSKVVPTTMEEFRELKEYIETNKQVDLRYVDLKTYVEDLVRAHFEEHDTISLVRIRAALLDIGVSLTKDEWASIRNYLTTREVMRVPPGTKGVYEKGSLLLDG